MENVSDFWRCARTAAHDDDERNPKEKWVDLGRIIGGRPESATHVSAPAKLSLEKISLFVCVCRVVLVFSQCKTKWSFYRLRSLGARTGSTTLVFLHSEGCSISVYSNIVLTCFVRLCEDPNIFAPC